MQASPDYLQFIAHNRQFLLQKARELEVTLTEEDLDDIDSPQILLDMSSDTFLNALKNEVFTLEEAKNILHSFCNYYSNHLNERTHTGDIFADSLSERGWSKVMAEAQTSIFLPRLCEIYSMCLNEGSYDMQYVNEEITKWGPKSLWTLHPDFITALDEERIHVEDIEHMSVADLETAVSENRYPNDPSFSYN